MEKYIKPEITEINLEKLNIFTGCKSYASCDDSCYTGDADDD